MQKIKLKVNKILAQDFSNDGIEFLKKEAINGNLSSKLDLIMHNQAVIAGKINKIERELCTNNTQKQAD